MQNRYCCDHGDFAKFGLLRKLCARDAHGWRLRLGVIWYLVPDESHNDDGKHTRYLKDTEQNHQRFRSCDPALWDMFNVILKHGKREVSEFQTHKVCAADTVYYDDILKWPVETKVQGEKGRAERLTIREAWVQRGFQTTKNCDIVVFDPDNGLNVKTKKYAAKGPKYAFLDEIVPYYKRGQSLVIYQHVNRLSKVEDQIQYRLQQLTEATGCRNPFAMLYHRGTARIFLIVPSTRDSKLLRHRADDLCHGPWGQHFELITMS